jgi:hypothetical protein
MSYPFNHPCTAFNAPCLKKDTCTDRHVVQGAISGIHSMPFGVGHLGAGSIELTCRNKTVAEERIIEKEPNH